MPSSTLKFDVWKTWYRAGVYDGNEFQCWPAFHLDEGEFLSAKGRLCSHRSAAEFESRQAAQEHFHSWFQKRPLKRGHYRLHVDSYQSIETVEIQLYDESHPLWAISMNEKQNVVKAARAYFMGYLHLLQFAPSTLTRYRKQLIPYGVDIQHPVPPEQDIAAKRNEIAAELEAIEEGSNTPRLV